jgi:hypothetical protein
MQRPDQDRKGKHPVWAIADPPHLYGIPANLASLVTHRQPPFTDMPSDIWNKDRAKSTGNFPDRGLTAVQDSPPDMQSYPPIA